MILFIMKAAIAGIIVATVSGIGLRYPRIGGILSTLPIVTILTFTFLLTTETPTRLELNVLARSIVFMSLITVIYPTSLYSLLRFTELSIPFVIVLSLIPLITGYRVMYFFLK